MGPSGWSAVALFAGGWVVFPGLFWAQLHLWGRTGAGRRLRRRYSLTDKDCADIANKVVSGFQALLATSTGTLVCSACAPDVLRRSHPLTLIYAWFGLPYFFYDTLSMFYVSTLADPRRGEEGAGLLRQFLRFVVRSPVIVIHHLVLAPVGFTLLLFFREGESRGDFFMGIIYLMEASTPFVCARFILSKLQLKRSRWYVANGLLMLVLFPVFRILSLFLAAGLYGRQQGLTMWQALWNMPLGWKAAFLTAVAPQMYWYALMWRGLLRMLRPGRDTGATAASSSS